MSDLPFIPGKVHAGMDGQRHGSPVAAVDFHQETSALRAIITKLEHRDAFPL
jgi:hypothetical protein